MPSPPDPEVPEKAKRRRFSAEYKLAILRGADACTEPGQIGALLRRERLYSSHLVDWRRQRSLPRRTSSTIGVASGRFDSQYLTGAAWSAGHSTSSQRTGSSPPSACRVG
jgi:hypothetical protein